MSILFSILAAIFFPLFFLIGVVYFKKIDLNTENIKGLSIIYGGSLVVCLALFGIFYAIAQNSMQYKEILDYKVVSAKHQMKWTTHEKRTYTTSSGSGKNRKTTTRVKHYTETHGPFYTLVLDNGGEIDTSLDGYNRARAMWRNESLIGVNHGSAAHFDTAISGNIYSSKWGGNFESIYPYSAIGSYRNKVRASSSSTFKHKTVSKEIVAKYPRPADQGNSNPIVSYGGTIALSGSDQLLLERTNAFLGPKYQVHTIIVAMNSKESGIGGIDDVLAAWEGPNKNELVIFVGLDDGIANWVKVESWMDNTELHSTIEGEMVGKKFNAKDISVMLLKNVPQFWHRKEFKDFEYLQVEVGGYFVAYIIVIFVSCLGGAIFMVVKCDDFRLGMSYSSNRNHYRYRY